MKRYFPAAARQSEEGSVAVEAAVCIAFILVPLLLFVLFFGRFFWHYTVAQKALHDATLYMAKAPLGEIQSGAAAALAKHIIDRETADLDSKTTLETWAICGYRISSSSVAMMPGECNKDAPLFVVQTNSFLRISDPFYFQWNGSAELQYPLQVTMRYAGK